MDKIRKLLGKRIQEIRTGKNITQEKLAELAGIDPRSLSSIECGHAFPSRCLSNISDALNTGLPDLFDFDHHAFTPDEMREYIKNSIYQLPDDKLTVLFRLTKDLQ